MEGEYGNYIEEIVFDYFRGKGYCIGHYRRGIKKLVLPASTVNLTKTQ